MRICIVGGAGFIGTSLTRLLVEAGRDVVVLDRRPDAPTTLSREVRYIPGDYADRTTLRTVFAQTDAVVDLAYATVPQTSYSDPTFDILANLPPSVGLIEEAVAAKLRRALIVSSGGTVYGLVDRLPIREDAPTAPMSPYGITKLTVEKYALMFHRLHDLPVTIVRPGNAFGAGQRAFTGQGFIATAMASVIKGDPVTVFGERGTVRDYVHVADVARGIAAALDRGAPGEIYNIGTGVGRSNLDVVDSIRPLAERAGRSVRLVFLPSRRFDVPANVLDSSKLAGCSGWGPQVAFAEGLATAWQAMVESRDFAS